MSTREDELIALHRALVQVPSINWGDESSAREIEVARVAGDYLNEHGVDSRTVESAPGRGNLLAELHSGAGGSNGPSLLLMGHSDVVPVGEESLWRFPPFSAEIADGRIWGRGANDCKMLVACELFAMASLARIGAPFAGELRLALGADEEAGGRWGFGWLAQNEAEFMRATLAVNEGGGAYLGRGNAGESYFLLGAGEKGRYELTFRAAGPGTHASVPWGRVNPVETIGKVLEALAAWNAPEIDQVPIVEALRGILGGGGLGFQGHSLENQEVTSLVPVAGSFSKAFRNSFLAQTRMTIVPTLIAAGEKTNAVPTGAELRCDARILPGQTRGELEEAIGKIVAPIDAGDGAGNEGLTWDLQETAAPSVSPYSPEIESLFKGALEQTFGSEVGQSNTRIGEIALLPSWCTGFTDSRFARDVGTPTYGFQVVEPGANPNRLGIHCVDESIEVGMLLPCARALGHLAIEFLGSD